MRVKIQPLHVVDESLFIMTGQDISLLEQELGLYANPANLPAVVQNLYSKVAGPCAEIVLETLDFHGFSEVVQRSYIAPKLIGHKLYVTKSTRFGKHDLPRSYLRITLNYNLCKSPGIQYVLEIWPAGHYVLIHDHGDANGVVKMCLNGSSVEME